MRGGVLAAALLVALLVGAATPAPASSATVHARTVEGLYALPTPLGPVTALDDSRAWEVLVPEGVTVFVDAQGAPGSLFHLRAQPAGAPEDTRARAPTTRDGETLGAGAWRVTLDPAAGARIRVDLVFRGYVGDMDGGSPAAFELRDLRGPNPCVVRGACLP